MDKKSRVRTGFFFGIWMSAFNIGIRLLTEENLTTKTIMLSIITGLIGGVIAGVLFGWSIGLFANSKYIKKATKINLETDETILFETSANHFKGAEAVGGKLYLTDKRLVFKSHNLNIQNHELSVNSHDILHVERYKTLCIVNNGLSVTTAGNKIEKFVVQDAASWVHHLADINSLQTS